MVSDVEFLDPHHQFEPQDERERFLLELLTELWMTYRRRVQYVREYEKVVSQFGGQFENDHIAFRTIALQDPACGISSISRIFEALGYNPSGCYVFPDKHLSAIHLQYPKPGLPKLFISELRTWELSEPVRQIVQATVRRRYKNILTDKKLLRLYRQDLDPKRYQSLLRSIVRYFHELPWAAPRKRDVVAVNEESQYAAWVMVHGYNVNHFTALVNSHQVEALNDIEKTVNALREAGVPMKESIEGEPGSKLRQTATHAVKIPVTMRDGGHKTQVEWNYAYFEIAERGTISDPDTQQQVRFEGFLGPQATQLFEMTRMR